MNAAPAVVVLGENQSWWTAKIARGHGPVYEFVVGGSWRGREQVRRRRLYRLTSIEVRKSDGYIQMSGVRVVADPAGGFRRAKSESWAAIDQASLRESKWMGS